MSESLVIDSLISAIDNEKPKEGIIIHTDQGSQYTGYRFYETIRENQCVHSHSRKGNPYDNVMMESFYKTLKRLVMPIKPYKTKSQAVLEVLEYLENYYNTKRIHSCLGYLALNEFISVTKSD